VDTTNVLTAPYDYTVPSYSATIPISITATDPSESIVVRNASGTALLTGLTAVSGSVPLVSGPNALTINVTSSDGESTASYPLTITNPAPNVPCFPAGTRILTASGYKAVETLAQGELVVTADGRQVPVKIYGKHLSETTTVTAPFRVPKGALGPSTPVQDLVLSPDHAFQIRKGLWMLPKRAALMSERIEQISIGNPVTYFHLECPQYLRDNLIVDGTVVESYGGKTKNPYTYSESLKGYTRTGPSIKRDTHA